MNKCLPLTLHNPYLYVEQDASLWKSRDVQKSKTRPVIGQRLGFQGEKRRFFEHLGKIYGSIIEGEGNFVAAFRVNNTPNLQALW